MNVLPPVDTNGIIIALAPILAGLVAYIYQLMAQRLPGQQRLSLEQFARLAVNKIEQVFPTAGSENKKKLATDLVLDLFKTFRLPAPDPRAIDTAIESAVLAINQAQQQAQATSGFLSSKSDPNPLGSLSPSTPAGAEIIHG